jgi:hypothetical protein
MSNQKQKFLKILIALFSALALGIFTSLLAVRAQNSSVSKTSLTPSTVSVLGTAKVNDKAVFAGDVFIQGAVLKYASGGACPNASDAVVAKKWHRDAASSNKSYCSSNCTTEINQWFLGSQSGPGSCDYYNVSDPNSTEVLPCNQKVTIYPRITDVICIGD